MSFFSNLPYSFIIIDILSIIGYIDTIRLMVKNRNPAPFNYPTCIILLSFNGLKILYYIFQPYEINSFIQAVSQFSIAIIMIYLKYYYTKKSKTLKSKKKSDNSSSSSKSSNKTKFRYFFMTKMDTFNEFLISFSIYFIIIFNSFIISYYLIDKDSTLLFISNVAQLIEFTISVPIFIKVVFQKDVKNLSGILILQFAINDIINLISNLFSEAFGWVILGNCILIFVESILVTFYLQVLLCMEPNHPKKKEIVKKEKLDDFDLKSKKISDGFSDEEYLIEKRNVKLDFSVDDI